MSPATIATTTGPAGARIAGMGHYRPERVVTNHDLEKIMDTNDEWIRSRVGISERRFAGESETVVAMGAEAGKSAITDAGLSVSDIDTIILATCTIESQVPSAATQIAAELGIHAPAAFDVNAACAGFCYGLGIASQLVRSGTGRNVLLIGSEKLTAWMDPTDRSTAIIFADGAGAAVVTGSDTEQVGPVAWGSDETQTRTIRLADRHSTIIQEGQAVFRWATSAVAPVAIHAVQTAGLQLSDIDVLASHQANLRIIDTLARQLITAGARPDLRVARDIVTTGNTSSASVPIALDRMRRDGQARRGDLVLAVGFGAGLTYAGQVFVCP